MVRSFLLILLWQPCCAKDGTGSPFIRIALPCFSRGPKRRGEVPWGGFRCPKQRKLRVPRAKEITRTFATMAATGRRSRAGHQRGQGTRASGRARRCTRMSVLRLDDGEKRFLLSLHGMWQHEWVLVKEPTGVWHGKKREQGNFGGKRRTGS